MTLRTCRASCLAALLVLALCPGMRTLLAQENKPAGTWALALHGGAGPDPKELNSADREKRLGSLRAALAIGREILANGGTSLDAVEKVVRFLEDDPQFNAGRGAVFNNAGGHELDASIMEGRAKACGAVAAVRTVKNPISLARLVMTQTPHVLLVGDGAEDFADHQKVERVDSKYFHTDHAYRQWQKAQQKEREGQQKAEVTPKKKGTVGCVALDMHGNLAAATSTGGLNNKRFGRVGDSPIIGAGTYADNATCAVSCTGVGEEFIRNAVAFHLSALMAYKGLSAAEAAKVVIHEKLQKDDGGLIVVARDGTIVHEFSTPGMSRGAANSAGRFDVAIEP